MVALPLLLASGALVLATPGEIRPQGPAAQQPPRPGPGPLRPRTFVTHYYGVEVAVERVALPIGPCHVWVRDLEPALVPGLVEDRAPASAMLMINGQQFPFYRNAQGELEAVFDLALLAGHPNGATVTVWDATGLELLETGLVGFGWL